MAWRRWTGPSNRPARHRGARRPGPHEHRPLSSGNHRRRAADGRQWHASQGVTVPRAWILSVLCVACLRSGVDAQLRLPDESDREAFRQWFVFLADAQYYRPSPDVDDCAALVRNAYREALRAHSPEWVRRSGLSFSPTFADVRRPPTPSSSGWPLFRVSSDPADALREFADAGTIVHYNTRPISKDVTAARPGDLLYFHQPEGLQPDHLMVFVGASAFEPGPGDWIVYHTGSLDGTRGEVRKVRLRDLMRHPSPRWRPLPANPAFVGVFRLAIL